MSAAKRNATARPPQTSVVAPTRGVSDFDRYLDSEDAQQAEFWHLHALLGLRRAMGDRPLSQSGYRRIRAALADEVTVRRFRSQLGAQSWLVTQRFGYVAAECEWTHEDGRRAVIERGPNATTTRYVRTWVADE